MIQAAPRIRAPVLVTALLLSAAGIASAAPSANPPERDRGPAYVDPDLNLQLEGPFPPEGVAIRVVLRHDDLPGVGNDRSDVVRARQQRVLDALSAGSFRIKYRHISLSGFSGWAHGAAIRVLANHPEVISIHADREVHATLAQGVPLIGADVVHGLGFTGQGINVAVVDTGIDTDHPDLIDDLVAEHCNCDAHPSPNFGACCPGNTFEADGPGSAEDDNGHGTNVSGIITSANAANPGVAPNAGIVAVKVLSSGGGGQASGIDAGLDWILTHHAALSIRIVNMSLGDGAEQNDPAAPDCSTDPTSVGIAALHAAGVAVFVASGNDGHDDGISAPACTAEAISVGGVYDQALGPIGWCGNRVCTRALCTDSTAPDVFVCHSNSDEILDLLAPNYRTATTALGGGTLAGFGGTSAASPYAAAEAALLLEADPALTPDALRTQMKAAGPLVTNPDNGLAFRRSDIGAIVTALPVCGNGGVEPGEDCDDGGTIDGDCCSSSCAFESAGSVCDDGDACTQNDTCDGSGRCTGPPLDCNDGNLCTDDACDPATGCTSIPNTDSCDDGDACTTPDTCAGGACAGGPPLDCDDNDPCTAESCDALTGCAHDPIIGCVAVPTLGPPAHLLLLMLLMFAGVAFLFPSRQPRSDGLRRPPRKPAHGAASAQ